MTRCTKEFRAGPFFVAVLWLAIVLPAMIAPAGAQSRTREYYDPPYEDREITDDDVRRASEDGRDARNDQWDDNGDRDWDSGDRTGNRRSDDADDRDLEDGEDAPDVSYFYEELEPDGRWFSHRDYGYVWTPHRVDAGWRPYTRGHWLSTEEHGWYWVSDEPFGWATYHYGRWYLDDEYGWVWVPGTRWGPAWVAWRSSDRHIGWAPLPPDAFWEPRRRTVVYHETIYEGPRYHAYWSFVDPLYISTPELWRHCAPRHRVTHIVRETRPSTHYRYHNHRIINAGIPVRHVERVTRRPVVRHRIAAVSSRAALGAPAQAGGAVQTFKPDLSRRAVSKRRQGRPVPFGLAPHQQAAPVKPGARNPSAVWRDVDRRKPVRRLPAALPGADRAAANPLGLPPKSLPAERGGTQPPHVKPAIAPEFAPPVQSRDKDDDRSRAISKPPQTGFAPPPNLRELKKTKLPRGETQTPRQRVQLRPERKPQRQPSPYGQINRQATKPAKVQVQPPEAVEPAPKGAATAAPRPNGITPPPRSN